MDLADEVPEHLLRHLKIGDHAVLHRTHGVDALRRSPEHHFCFLAHSQDFIETGFIFSKGNHRGLVEHDPFAFYVDECVRSPEVDCQII